MLHKNLFKKSSSIITFFLDLVLFNLFFGQCGTMKMQLDLVKGQFLRIVTTFRSETLEVLEFRPKFLSISLHFIQNFRQYKVHLQYKVKLKHKLLESTLRQNSFLRGVVCVFQPTFAPRFLNFCLCFGHTDIPKFKTVAPMQAKLLIPPLSKENSTKTQTLVWG